MKRRNFIGMSGLAMSSIAVQPKNVYSNIFKTVNNIKVGVIGTGGRGNWLIKLIGGIPGMEVTACCDILPFRLEQGMKLASPNARSYTDYREILDSGEIDAVIIATPLSMHYEMAVDALDAGKHVYCEKTMVFSIDEAIKLDKKVKAANQVFQVGYQHRYNPLYHNIYNTIKDGYIGTVTHVEAHWNRNGNWRRPVPDPQYERIINWRMYKEYSGGLMAELCSHQVDLIDYILNSHAQKITGMGGINYWKDGRETFDNIYTILEYPEGVKASFHSITTNTLEGFNVKIYGTKAAIVVMGEASHKGYIYPEPKVIEELKTEVDGVSSATMKILEAGEPLPIIVEDFPEGDDGPTSAALAHFGRCISEGLDPIANVEFGKKSAITVALANQSMREDTIEYWKEDYS
jgi:predicted dehydrogenase